MSATELLLTAEEFRRLPENGQPMELVRGKVVAMNMPGFRHGNLCARIARHLGNHCDAHNAGRVVCNDTGVVTERDPDTVRGADVAFFSYERLPRDVEPDGYPDVAPDVVFEVLSPTDRWANVLCKVGEYLAIGVLVVCVVDPENETVVTYYPDRPNRTWTAVDELLLPEIAGEFRLALQVLCD